MAPTKETASWQALPLTVSVAAMAGACVAELLFERLHMATPVSALCSLAALCVTYRRAQREFATDRRRAFVLALGASAVAAFIALGIWFVHVHPAWVESTYSRFDHGEPPAQFCTALSLALFGLPFIALTEGFAAVAFRPLRVAVRALVAPLAVVVIALAFAGLVRRVAHPAPESPVHRLPVVADFPAPAVADGVAHHAVGALTLTVRCVESYSPECHVLLQRSANDPLPVGWPTSERALPINARMESYVPPGASLRVRRDARRDLWVVETTTPVWRFHAFAAFRGPDLARVNLDLRDFPGDFGPPLGWPVAALGGVALALWFARRARFVDALPAGPLLDAVLSPERTLHLPDGTTLPGPSGPVGPVVVAAPSPSLAPYRDPTTAVLRAGTVAQWRDALGHDRDVRAALALSTLVLLGTPLLIAARLRLLW